MVTLEELRVRDVSPPAPVDGDVGEVVVVDVDRGVVRYVRGGDGWGIIRFAEVWVRESSKAVWVTDLAGTDHVFHYVTYEARDGKLYFTRQG